MTGTQDYANLPPATSPSHQKNPFPSWAGAPRKLPFIIRSLLIWVEDQDPFPPSKSKTQSESDHTPKGRAGGGRCQPQGHTPPHPKPESKG